MNKGRAVGRLSAFALARTSSAMSSKCGINRLKPDRAVTTGYDKRAVRYQATIHIAAISEWLCPDFLNRPRLLFALVQACSRALTLG
jgi:hypothetical protein